MSDRLQAVTKWVLRLDGMVSLAFGLSTVVAQHAIFSTAVDLASANVTGDGSTVMESALFALSGYYAVVGAIALALSAAPRRFQGRLALLLGVHHAFMAAKGIAEAGHVWIVGNPWWDIAIHTLFALAYAVLLVPRKQAAISTMPQRE